MMNNQHQIQLTVQGYPVATRGVIVPKGVQAIQALIAWRNRHQGVPDYWLRAVICQAFERMIPRRMQDTPAADLIEIVAEDWIDIIGQGMEQDLDLERVVAGFRLIFRECRRWPQPADLLKRLPRRIVGAGSSRPQTQQSDEEHAAAAAKFQELIDSLK